MNMRIDLNADLGENAGHDDELLTLVTSANIACGVHAGDANTISLSIAKAKVAGVAIGAHPSLWDREYFGRRELLVTPDEVFALIVYQLAAFHALAHAAGARPHHVKPHGALYNMAARDRAVADAIARAVVNVDGTLILFAPGESELARAGAARGLRIAREVFADRNYLADGSLVPRTNPGALLHDPEEAAARVMRMLREGVVRSIEGKDVEVRAETVCVHGDTPGAVQFARAPCVAFSKNGIAIAPPERTL